MYMRLTFVLVVISTSIYSQKTFEDYFKSGLANDSLHRFKDAVKDFDKAIELKTNADLYYYRANARFELKEYKEAVSDYSKAIEMNSNYFEAFYNRGNTRFEMKDYSSAIEDFDKALA